MADGEKPVATAEPEKPAEPATTEADPEPEVETTTGEEPEETQEGEVEQEPAAEWVQNLLAKVPDEHLAPKVKDRFAKMAAQEKVKNAELKTLREEVATLKTSADIAPVVLTPSASNPLAHVTTPEMLQSQADLHQEILDTLTDNPEGGVFTIGDTKFFYTEEAAQAAFEKGVIKEPTVDALVKNDKVWAKKVLREVPKAEKAMEKRNEVKAEIKKLMPKLYERDSAEAKEARALIESFPELLRNPESDRVIAQLILGKRALDDQKAGTQTIKVTTKPPVAKPPVAKAAVNLTPKSGVRTAESTINVEALREKAQAGNRAAADQLAEAFLTPLKR